MAVCNGCGNNIGFYTSQKQGSFMEVNRRSVLAAWEIGCGRADLEMSCAMMNLPPPVARKSFTGYVGAIFDALKVRCNESMYKSQELVKQLENEFGHEPDDGFYNIAVSHDATWHITLWSSFCSLRAIWASSGL